MSETNTEQWRRVDTLRVVSEWHAVGCQQGGLEGLALRLAAHVEKARAEALEEAARACEAVGEERPKVWTGGVVARACAAAIRALKGSQE